MRFTALLAIITTNYVMLHLIQIRYCLAAGGRLRIVGGSCLIIEHHVVEKPQHMPSTP
jgi:hypothetical protein